MMHQSRHKIWIRRIRANENIKHQHRKKTKLRNKGNDNWRISQSKTGYEGKTKTEVTVTEMLLKI